MDVIFANMHVSISMQAIHNHDVQAASLAHAYRLLLALLRLLPLCGK